MSKSSLTILAALFLVGASTTACSEGGFGADRDTGTVQPEPDTGGMDDKSDADAGMQKADTAPDTSEMSDTGPTGDGGADTGPQGSSPKVEAFTNCGAGGVSQGGGVRAVQCYGPSEQAGEEPSGNGVRWQPGAFRIVTE